MRGERRGELGPPLAEVGSPPHARGKGRRPADLRPGWRFTPACAGKGNGSFRPGAGRTVHPRMRGERCGYPRGLDDEFGSPPHARGKVGERPFRHLPHRFTPACAGKGGRCWMRRWRLSVHPRMRGERAAGVVQIAAPAGVAGNDGRVVIIGSPPHARGKGLDAHPFHPLPRFTPACAGKGSKYDGGTYGYPVHPRMRGERSAASRSAWTAAGSPPHARGKGLPVIVVPAVQRFTPACAGKGTAKWEFV